VKRVLILALGMICLSIPAFAQLQLGGTAFYMAPLDQSGDNKITPNDFLYGAEARLLLGPLEGSATGVFQPPYDDGMGGSFPPAISAMFDGGLGISLLGLVRVGGEAGINVIQPLGGSGTEKALNAGANVRLLATASLLGLNVGANATLFYPSFAAIADPQADPPEILFGVSVLLNL